MNKNKILIDLSESAGTSFGKVDFAAQSIPQKVFSSVWAVESEVNNGGFLGYFGNRSAETAPFVAEALDKIGAPNAAAICRRALACAYPGGLPATPAEISEASLDFSEETLAELEGFDAEFLGYPHD